MTKRRWYEVAEESLREHSPSSQQIPRPHGVTQLTEYARNHASRIYMGW